MMTQFSYGWTDVNDFLPIVKYGACDYEPSSMFVEVLRKTNAFEDGKNVTDNGAIYGDGKWHNNAGNVIYVTHWRTIKN